MIRRLLDAIRRWLDGEDEYVDQQAQAIERFRAEWQARAHQVHQL